MLTAENKTYTIKVYNTLTAQYEEVAVSKEVYQTYMRTEWNIKDNNKSYYDHEIQMSGLVGGENGNYENFPEFIDTENTPEELVLDEVQKSELKQIVAKFSKEDRSLLQAIFIEGLSEREYARRLGVFHNAVHKRKLRIIGRIKKLLEI